jgi:hypothetical protein
MEKRRNKVEIEAEIVCPSTIDETKDRWLHLFLTSEESSNEFE